MSYLVEAYISSFSNQSKHHLCNFITLFRDPVRWPVKVFSSQFIRECKRCAEGVVDPVHATTRCFIWNEKQFLVLSSRDCKLLKYLEQGKQNVRKPGFASCTRNVFLINFMWLKINYIRNYLDGKGIILLQSYLFTNLSYSVEEKVAIVMTLKCTWNILHSSSAAVPGPLYFALFTWNP